MPALSLALLLMLSDASEPPVFQPMAREDCAVVAAALGDAFAAKPLNGLDGWPGPGQTILADLSSCPWRELGAPAPRISRADPSLHILFPIERPAPDRAMLHGFEALGFPDGRPHWRFFVCEVRRTPDGWRRQACRDTD